MTASREVSVLNPYFFSPRLERYQLPGETTSGQYHINRLVFVTGINATFEPLANPWMHSFNTLTPAPTIDDSDEGEVITLDDEILERNLVTGVIGECGRNGCRVGLGCRFCVADSDMDPTPRTSFRTAVAAAIGDTVTVVEPENNQYPTHLQRMGTVEPPEVQSPAPLQRPAIGDAVTVEQPKTQYPKYLQRMDASAMIALQHQAPSIMVTRPAERRAAGGFGPRIKYCKRRPIAGAIEGEIGGKRSGQKAGHSLDAPKKRGRLVRKKE